MFWSVLAGVAIVIGFPHLSLAWYLIIAVVIAALPSVAPRVRA